MGKQSANNRTSLSESAHCTPLLIALSYPSKGHGLFLPYSCQSAAVSEWPISPLARHAWKEKDKEKDKKEKEDYDQVTMAGRIPESKMSPRGVSTVPYWQE